MKYLGVLTYYKSFNGHVVSKSLTYSRLKELAAPVCRVPLVEFYTAQPDTQTFQVALQKAIAYIQESHCLDCGDFFVYKHADSESLLVMQLAEAKYFLGSLKTFPVPTTLPGHTLRILYHKNLL